MEPYYGACGGRGVVMGIIKVAIKMSIREKIIEVLKKLISLILLQKRGRNFEAFAEALGQRESGGNYQAKNPYGYLGKWQFGMARLADLGLTERVTGTKDYGFMWKQGYSQEYFLNTPELQDRIFRQHVGIYLDHANTYFAPYYGQSVNGVLITPSGCVAGAHIGGLGGVKKFLESGYDPADANGTRISAYVKEFGGYKLEL